MQKAKRLLSFFMALTIVLGMFTCLASTASAYDESFWSGTSVKGITNVKTYNEVADEHGTDLSDLWTHYSLEVYEKDDNDEWVVIDNHELEPGQELKVKVYMYSNWVIGNFNEYIFFENSIFDINKEEYIEIDEANAMYDDDEETVIGSFLEYTPREAVAAFPNAAFFDKQANVSRAEIDKVMTTNLQDLSTKFKTDYFGPNYPTAQSLSNAYEYVKVMANRATGKAIYVQNVNSPIFEFTVNVRDNVTPGTVGHMGFESTFVGATTRSFTKGLKATSGVNSSTKNDWTLGVTRYIADTQHTFKIKQSGGSQTTQYTASFNANGGSAVTSITADEGTSITLPSSTKTGLSLKWSDGTNEYNPGSPYTLNADTSFTANWYATVNYNANGGTASKTTETVREGASVVLPTLSRTGFTGKWSDGTTTYDPSASVTITKNTNFTAQWTEVEKEQYTIKFAIEGKYFADGNDVIISSTVIEEGSAITRPTAAEIEAKLPAGYRANGYTTTVPATATANATYYVKLEAKTYAVEFWFNDTRISSTNQTFGSVITTPSDETIASYLPAGKTFEGWFTAAQGGTALKATDTVPVNGAKYYAHFGDAEYTVTFLDYEGQVISIPGFTNPATYHYGDTIVVPDIDDDQYSYTFNNPETCTGSATYRATGRETRKYTVTYTAVNPLNASQSESYTARVEAGAAFPAYAGNEINFAGTTFVKWVDADGKTPADYTAMPTKNVVFTAEITKIDYTVKFIGYKNGTENAVISTGTYNYGDTIASAPAADREGYSYTWKTSQGVTASFPFTVTAEETFTADYKAGSFTITYILNGETKYTDTYNTGDPVTARAFPAKTGYAETAWADEIPATMPARNVTITGTLTAKVHHIIFTDGTTTYYECDVAYDSEIPYADAQAAINVAIPAGYTGYDLSYTNTILRVDDDLTITVTFNAGSAIVTIETYTQNFADGDYTKTSETVTRGTGSRFNYTAAEKEGFTIDRAQSVLSVIVEGSGSSIIKVYYNRDTHVVKWVDNSGTETVTYYYGQAIVVKTPAPKTGSQVASANGGWDKAVEATMGTKDLTYTAKYEEIQYTITIINRVTGRTYKTIRDTYGKPVPAQEPQALEGYTFKSFSAPIPETMPAENITIYMDYDVNTYTLTIQIWDTVKQTEIDSSVVKDYAFGAQIDEFIRKDYTGFTFLRMDTIPATMPATNKTVRVNYERNAYDVTFMIDGTEKKVSTYYGDIPVAPEANKTGNTFQSWDKEIVAVTGAGDVYTAIFVANNYTAIFDANGGKFADNTTTRTVPNVTFGTSFSAPTEEPTNGEYYVFGGWALESAPKTKVTTFSMTTEGVRYVAIWNQNMDAIRVQDAGRITKGYYETGLAQYYVIVNSDCSKIQICQLDESGNRIPGLTKTFTKANADANLADTTAGLKSVELVADGEYAGMYKWTFNTYLDDSQFEIIAKIDSATWESAGYKCFTNTYDSKLDDGVAATEFISAALKDSDGSEATTVVRGEQLTWTIETSTDVEWLKFVGTVNGTEKTTWFIANEQTVRDSGSTRTWTIPMTFTYSGSESRDAQSWKVYYCLGNSSVFSDSGATKSVVVRRFADTSVEETGSEYSVISAQAEDTEFNYKSNGTITIKTTADVTKVQICVDGKATTYQETSKSVVSCTTEGNEKTWVISYKFTVKGTNEYTVKARGTTWSAATKIATITVK
ncbi:MAG: InlB B-repeat-containing protein [Clostridiales bacterium]|nr:InlB B-repeat-containing protein [Clostridiales bacterium]